MEIDYERRFGGVSRLYGPEGAKRLRAASVCIIGIGGVGSWSAEALARTGIGRISVVDLDMVAESNPKTSKSCLAITIPWLSTRLTKYEPRLP